MTMYSYTDIFFERNRHVCQFCLQSAQLFSAAISLMRLRLRCIRLRTDW